MLTCRDGAEFSCFPSKMRKSTKFSFIIIDTGYSIIPLISRVNSIPFCSPLSCVKTCCTIFPSGIISHSPSTLPYLPLQDPCLSAIIGSIQQMAAGFRKSRIYHDIGGLYDPLNLFPNYLNCLHIPLI